MAASLACELSPGCRCDRRSEGYRPAVVARQPVTADQAPCFVHDPPPSPNSRLSWAQQAISPPSAGTRGLWDGACVPCLRRVRPRCKPSVSEY